jgi:hypothetical protein
MTTTTIDLSPFLSLFKRPGADLWPRRAMGFASKGQVTVNDERDLEELIEASDRLDCFIQSHTAEDKARGLLYLVFIDLDCPGDLARAERLKGRVVGHIKKEFEVEPYVQFSGFKGYHVLVPMKTTQINPPSMAPEFLRFCQLRLSKGYCDPQLLGDVVRLMRILGTYNSKAIRAGMDGLVKVVQEWDGQELASGLLWEEFHLFKLEEELQRKKQKTAKFTAGPKEIRPQVSVLIERARQGVNLSHRQRLAITLEFLARGYGDEEILEIFSSLPDFDERKTRYYIEHARRAGYKPFTSQHLKEVLP